MKKLFRFLLVAGVLGVGLLVIAGVALKIYLTEERLRTLVLPPMREALGREVEIASLKIDLFSGIKIAGLVVKEADGKTDFVAVKEFSLGYSLLPLLDKRLEITKVKVENPVIKVWRDRLGLYNFSNLKVLQNNHKVQTSLPEKTADAKVPAAALPLSLVVQHCEFRDVVVSFHDELGEFPKVELKANLKTRLDLGDLTPASINAHGELDFVLNAQYRSLAPEIQGKVDFDRQQVAYQVVVKQENEECILSGSVKDYLGAKPAIVLNLDSPRLDLAYLAALGQKLSIKGTAVTKPVSLESSQRAKPDSSVPFPPQLTAHGKVDIKQALYENYRVDSFTLDYKYQDALLTISELKGEVADGSFTAAAAIKPFLAQPDFQGEFSFSDLQVPALMAMAKPALKDNLSGSGYGKFKFSGRGADAAALQKSLSIAGEYGLRQGGLDNIPLTKTLAQVLGLPELENLKIAELDGNLRLKDGKVGLKSSWDGNQLSGQAEGQIGLDGSLDLPLNLVLSRQLSLKMAQRYPWFKETFNENEEAAVGLSLAGTLSNPKLRLDEKKVQKQLQKKLEKKLFEKLEEKLAEKDGDSGAKSGDPKPEDLLRQFLKK